MHSFLHFSRAKDVIKHLIGTWENEHQISQNYTLHIKFSEFYRVFTILMKFDIRFLGLPQEIFFGVITDDYLHLESLKNVKTNAIFFKSFWYKVFVHWKLKLLNFLVDSVLITFEWIIKQLLNSAFIWCEDLCKSQRMLSTSAFDQPRWMTSSLICTILHILLSLIQ